ncbi:PLDc N-terminal domain-containing protein [uncultured Sneathia sp.]|uniref:PLDc N-terminal domain-containing protein n=1 Tax=uncultured Sneathia sp. TaxID=278067 RepID=UPI0035A5852F
MLPVYIGRFTVYLVLVIYCILSIVRNPKFDAKKKVIWTLVVVLVQIIGPSNDCQTKKRRAFMA